MKKAGQDRASNASNIGKKKVIKFKPKTFKEGPDDQVLYSLEESVGQRFDKTRLLRESTLEYNGFSQDVMENFPGKAKEILTIAREGVYDDKRSVLNEMARVIGVGSISCIKGSNHWQDDWQNNVCAFIDLGDDNAKTIVYDTIAEEFSVMNVNDFVLLKDQDYRIIGSEGL